MTQEFRYFLLGADEILRPSRIEEIRYGLDEPASAINNGWLRAIAVSEPDNEFLRTAFLLRAPLQKQMATDVEASHCEQVFRSYDNVLRCLRAYFDPSTRLTNLRVWSDQDTRNLFEGWETDTAPVAKLDGFERRLSLQSRIAKAVDEDDPSGIRFAIGGPFAKPELSAFRFKYVYFPTDNYLSLCSGVEAAGTVGDLSRCCAGLSCACSANQRLEQIARAVTFIVQVTFDSSLGWEKRRDRLIAHNDLFRVMLDDEEETIIATSHGVFPLGRVEGFSAVAPLTAKGLTAYLENSIRYSELDYATDIAKTRRSTAGVIIGGAAYLPVVPLMLEAQENLGQAGFVPDEYGRFTHFPNTGSAFIFKTMLPHVLDLLPELQVEFDNNSEIAPRAYVQGRDDKHELPSVICFISKPPLGMGRPILIRRQFELQGLDKGENEKFVLNLNLINDVNVPLEKRRRMAAIIKFAKSR